MALTVSTDTRTAVNALFGGTASVESAVLINFSNPKDDDATAIDWDVIGAAMENLIARFAEVGTTFTQDNGVIRAKFWLCLWDYQQEADYQAQLDALLDKYAGSAFDVATDAVAQDADDNADRPWLFSESKIDGLLGRANSRGNRSPRGL